jgi:hypothetical protein
MFSEDLVVLKNLEPKIVEKDVYRYLRYNMSKTELTDDIKSRISDNFDYAMSLMEISGVGCIRQITGNTGDVLTICGGYDFSSKYMCEWLYGCSHILLMGATAGRDVMDKINSLQKQDLLNAVVINAVASSAADQALEYLEKFFARLVFRSKMVLTDKRWSVGYADLDLKYQHIFYKLLKMNTIGVDILDSGMLVPEKSVTGFCGIS